MHGLPPPTVVIDLESRRVSLIIMPHLAGDLDRRAWIANAHEDFVHFTDGNVDTMAEAGEHAKALPAERGLR